MSKYKVCVYAICKNEEKFIKRWVKSMSEADDIYVLDTGSTDNSVSLLKEAGVHVKVKKIKTWRFDKARNLSLDMVPLDTDICVCTDIDEVFDEGWRSLIEESWTNDTTKLKYNYNWSFDEYGKAATSFYIAKIHKRDGYKWVRPVHEVLEYAGIEKEKIVDGVTLNHYPDSTKSRASYLPLLELSVKENPEDDRSRHYLGREYMYYQRYNDAIDTLIKHLSLKSSTWDAERCASMRFIGRSYRALNRVREAKMWYNLAIREASYLRESYVELASIYLSEANYEEAYNLLKQAFLIKNKAPIYINEAFAWNDYIYDLMAIASFNLKLYPESLENAQKAWELNPKDKRLKNNYDLINKFLNNAKK